ncbi:MAG: S8/S53 family peptidase [Bacteroidales bacterium]|jgi:subtilisin family serine protease|nr:S8/S53 family peptidase [Bacteroidales bacterium]
MKNLYILLIGFWGLIPLGVNAQSKKIRVLLPTEQELITNENSRLTFKSERYNKILKDCDSLKQAFPYSKNDTLRRVYSVFCETEKISLLQAHKNKKDIEELYVHEECKTIELYDPIDFYWNSAYQDGTPVLWHLKKIQADSAWDITKGSYSTKIAILDTWFDINHPDLQNQMYCTYDPYDNQPFYSASTALKQQHGTRVASFAASHTDGGGALAGVGFNCKIIPYKAWNGYYLERAHHASLAMNADVLTSSAGGWNCDTNFNNIERIAVKEILDNNTVIVMPAGNGWNGTHCAINGILGPWRPLHPHYDDRIIIVSGTDKNDNHTFFFDGTDITHSHFPYVDICSPGYILTGATSTIDENGNPINWPYQGMRSGTSFATPIVAGVCALLKSINPNLTPAEIKNIIKSTADPITDAYLYPGQLGAGRINAYAAVQAACPITTIPPQTITNTHPPFTGCRIYAKNVTVKSGAKLTLDASCEATIESDFEVELGSELEIK